MPEEVLFETESTHDRETIAAYFRDVADKLDAGEPITLSTATDSVTLTVPETPTFEVKAERETTSGGGSAELSIEFELEWGEGPAAETGESGSLSIE
ncbi:MAG: amphi-Trp domain-containing protein [Halobacteriota archaeon]